MGSVIVVPSVRFESSNPNLSGNHGDHLNTQLHHHLGHHPAEAYVLVAQAFEHMGTMSNPMLAALVFQTSADAYQEAGRKSDAERVQRLVEESNLAAVEEMKPQKFNAKINTRDIEEFLSNIIHESMDETLRVLAISLLIRRSHLEDFLSQTSKKFPLSTMFSQTMIQGSRVSAAIGSIDDDPKGHLILEGGRHLTLSCLWLKSAFERGQQKHSWTAKELSDWANRCDLFENPTLLEAGLSAWLSGDHIAAVHILVPQVEGAFRNLARTLGRPTTKPDRYMKRARSLKTFGELLNDPETVAALGPNGPDLELHFQALFTDARGHNLRNEVAHGFLAADKITPATSMLVVHSILILGAWLQSVD